jgi:class 3 adenylate cyclase
MIASMSDFASKNLREPDETIRMEGVQLDVVDLGDLTVGRAVHEPGWRWSTHVRPTAGGEWCQVRHVGVVLSGRLGILMSDGTSFELEEGDVYDIPPDHDGYVIGHEQCEMIEWTGLRAFAGFTGGLHNRLLATMLVTELVGSSARARELGDAAWREFLSAHLERVRAKLEQFRGKEIVTAGDTMLVTFNSPAQALRCAEEIQRVARGDGLSIRAGVHVGEVEIVGANVRGAAVDETQRIMEAATENEILVSETTRALASSSGLRFEDRGERALEGLGDRHLYAYVAEGEPAPM